MEDYLKYLEKLKEKIKEMHAQREEQKNE